MIGAFRIDVYTASAVKIAQLTDIGKVKLSDVASQIGLLSFTAPAAAAQDAQIGDGSRYRLYHARHGYLGEFAHDESVLSADEMTVEIKAFDALSQLDLVSCDFNMAFANASLGSVLALVLSRAGWLHSLAEGDYYPVSRDVQGESVFQVLDALRRGQRGWFRRGGTGTVEFGRFTDEALNGEPAFWLTNPPSGITDAPSVTHCEIASTSRGIVNRIIALGQGLGETQLDLRYSNRTGGQFAIQSRANWDGTNLDGTNPSGARTRTYYMENTASIALYGIRERAIVYGDIRPITNSDADKKNAANALHDLTEVRLAQLSAPTINYSISAINVPMTLRPGMVVGVDYRRNDESRGGTRSVARINMKKFFVLGIEWDFHDVSGVPVATLTVAENGERAADVTDVFRNLLADNDKLRFRPAPSMCYDSFPGGLQPIRAATASLPLLSHVNKFVFGTDVLEINNVQAIFELRRLRVNGTNSTGPSSASTTSAGGGTVVTSSSGGGIVTSSAGGGTVITSTDGDFLIDVSAVYYTPQVTQSGLINNSNNVLTSTGGAWAGTTGVIGVTGQYGSYQYFQNHWHELAGHTHPIDGHYHRWYLPFHPHKIVLQNHQHTLDTTHTHIVILSNHAHDMYHIHALAFEITEDNVTPSVTVLLDGVEISTIKNWITGAFATPNAPGWYVVNLTAQLQALTNWRGSHTLEIRPDSGRGEVFSYIRTRITIQAIAVED